MSIWICRAGRKSIYVKDFLCNNKIYCTWDGFMYDLNLYRKNEDLKNRILNDNKDASSTAINTWASQLIIFRDKMQVGDIVLVPNENSRSYNVGKIIGDYCYDVDSGEHFYHSRKVKWIEGIILRESFPQNVIYSLGAYRTIFRFKYEEELNQLTKKIGIKI